MEDVSLPDHRNINHSNFRKARGQVPCPVFFIPDYWAPSN